MFNKILGFIQSKTEAVYQNSYLLQNIDLVIMGALATTFLASLILPSGAIGLGAWVVIMFTFVKLLFVKGQRIDLLNSERLLIVFLLIIFVSLCGSTLFVLSFKGFLKTLTYILFYFSVAQEEK